MFDSVEVLEADEVCPKDLENFRLKYESYKKSNPPKMIPKQVRFDYSWSLIRSKDNKLVGRGRYRGHS
jgi:hypothetical protein